MIAQLMRKDLRRFAPFLLAVVVWAVSETVAMITSARSDDLASHWRWPLVELLLPVIAGLIVLADPPARRAAAWRLLPVGTARLLAAKLGLIAALIFLFAGLQLVALAWLGSTAEELAMAFAEATLRLAAIAATAMALASLVSRRASFMAALLGAMVLNALIQNTWLVPQSGGDVGFASQRATQVLLGTLALALGGTAVYARQLRKLDRWRSLVLAVAVVAVAITLRFAPVDLLARPAKGLPAAARLRATEPTWLRSERALTVSARLDDRPPGIVYQVTAIDTELILADGRAHAFHGGDMFGIPPDCKKFIFEALERSGRRLAGENDTCRHSRPFELHLMQDPWGQDRERGWSIDDVTSVRATIQAEAIEPTIRARPALSTDRWTRYRAKTGADGTIKALIVTQGQPLLLLRGETRGWRQMTFSAPPLLYLPRRMQLAKSIELAFQQSELQAVLQHSMIVYQQWRINILNAVDQAWLEEAELITFHGRWLGTVRWTVELDGTEIKTP